MSSFLYLVLFYAFTGIDLSRNRLLLDKELSCETGAFPCFQFQPAVRPSTNSRNAHVGTYKDHIVTASHKCTALEASTEKQPEQILFLRTAA